MNNGARWILLNLRTMCCCILVNIRMSSYINLVWHNISYRYRSSQLVEIAVLTSGAKSIDNWFTCVQRSTLSMCLCTINLKASSRSIIVLLVLSVLIQLLFFVSSFFIVIIIDTICYSPINNRSKILLVSTAITILNMSSVIDQLVLVIICYEIRLTNSFINSLTILISIDNICNFNVEK